MQNNVVKNEFDLKAGHYETNRLAQWYKAHANEILNQVHDFDSGDILDIGCATGYQLRLLCERFPDAKLVGLDISDKMTQQASEYCEQLSRDIHFITDDWENLTDESRTMLENYSFRLIICANTVHYFIDPIRAIRQMYEMLDRDGMLLILEREKTSSPLTLLWGVLHRHLIKDQVEFYSADTIMAYLSQAGFKNVNVLSSIKKYFWKGKLFTSIALIKGNKIND